MNDEERQVEFLRGRLQQAMPPVDALGPATDLWPRMLRRMEVPAASFGWFEGALVAMIVISLLAFPRLIPMMLYHL